MLFLLQEPFRKWFYWSN